MVRALVPVPVIFRFFHRAPSDHLPAELPAVSSSSWAATRYLRFLFYLARSTGFRGFLNNYFVNSVTDPDPFGSLLTDPDPTSCRVNILIYVINFLEFLTNTTVDGIRQYDASTTLVMEVPMKYNWAFERAVSNWKVKCGPRIKMVWIRSTGCKDDYSQSWLLYPQVSKLWSVRWLSAVRTSTRASPSMPGCSAWNSFPSRSNKTERRVRIALDKECTTAVETGWKQWLGSSSKLNLRLGSYSVCLLQGRRWCAFEGDPKFDATVSV